MMKIRKVAAVVVVNSEGKILVTKRAPGRLLSGYWDTPAGGLEAGESLEECAIRETREESGFEIDNLKKGLTVSVPTGEVVQQITFFMAKVQNPKVVLNSEHSEYRWVIPEEAYNYKFGVALAGVRKVLKDFNLVD